MAWKLFGKGSSSEATLSTWIPQIQEASKQLEEIELGLQANPEKGEQYLPRLEQIRGILKSIPDVEGWSGHVRPLIQHVDYAIAAIRNQDYSEALASVKQAVAAIHQVLEKLQS